MKIAIPLDEKSMESGVCPSFGRAPYFLIYDADTASGEFLDNAAAASQGGAGIKAAQSLVDRGVGTLLTPRCGENAEEVLKQAGIEVFKTTAGTVKQNLDAFSAGKLERLGEFHPGFHGNVQ